MSKSIENLLKNSRLPGPRGNLELLYSFSKTATEKEIKECLSFAKDDLHNSPEEFVVMCGIVGYCIFHKDNIKSTLTTIRKYASHNSWRIREAVAIGIQEIIENDTKQMIQNLKQWMQGNELEKRAVVAALCEPKLLKEKAAVMSLLEVLQEITMTFDETKDKLSEEQNSLRKTLGYCWSVAIVPFPTEGKSAFEKIIKSKNKHIRWIIKENLKKNRLIKMDRNWVDKILKQIS
ncbi:hypothetical protein [Leptospira brenneri]|uniref:HEAT repeat domain-containing protein n=1 Tax=Leptospira brenneri TaxID=2023182 RepID=A0A2M9XX23_9LEPT|nr:hypothetical protein [Leptospira brenneri]PJZ43829.1 hypothetical protein CH361_18295 [Leptospira brenneri]TGK92404.1 hypothetical protein EHQ30_13185 [Leptospira brenneri]